MTGRVMFEHEGCNAKIKRLEEQVDALINENSDLNGRIQDLADQLVGVEA